MNTQNKATVRLFINEALNHGNLSVIDEIIHPDYRYQSPTESMHGTSDLKAFVLALRSAFPDLSVAIDEQIAEADRVCTQVTLKGTHSGDFFEIPATGKPIHLQGVILSGFEGGLIREEWELLDQLSLLQQLGIVAHS